MWHGLASIALHVGGKHPIRHAVYHAPPPEAAALRAKEAKHIAKRLTRTKRTRFVILGMDQDSIGEDTSYDQVPAPSPFISQERVSDRKPAAEFTQRGLIDVAHWLDVGQYRHQGMDTNYDGMPLRNIHARATIGHYIDPHNGTTKSSEQRTDVIRANAAMLSAITRYAVLTDYPRITTISAHLPILIEYDPSRLTLK